jgi:hypothetical protein
MNLLITYPNPAISLSGIPGGKSIQSVSTILYKAEDIHRIDINTNNTDVLARIKYLVGQGWTTSFVRFPFFKVFGPNSATNLVDT